MTLESFLGVITSGPLVTSFFFPFDECVSPIVFLDVLLAYSFLAEERKVFCVSNPCMDYKCLHHSLEYSAHPS